MTPDHDTQPGTVPRAASILDTDPFERDVAREFIRAALFRRAAQTPALGRYQLLRKLGSGGMGVVYLAHDPRLDRSVAVKVLRGGSRDASARDLLLREARSIARLSHPNVVTVYDADVERERVFIAMEYVDGDPLLAWVDAPRPWPEAVELLVQAGRGLAAAHAAGMIHRDFKPANVLVGRDGRARVVDFGLAIAGSAPPAAPRPAGSPLAAAGGATVAMATTLRRSLGLAGTPAYMAPEQFIAGTSDARSDQFSFSVSAFEVLYGRRPFEADTLAELYHALLHRAPAFPESGPALPPALREILSRGLARMPHDRFPDMNALLDALAQVLADEAPQAPAPAPPADAPRSRAEAYLAALPAGLDGYPACTTRAALVRLALTRRPLGDDAPAAVRDALAHPSLRGEWMATARARLILLALYERHFAAPEAWRDFSRGLSRARLSGGMQVLAMPRAGSSRALDYVAREWSAAHQGTPLALEPAGPGRARVSVAAPERLLDDLFALEIEEHLRALFELMGARFFELQLRAGDHERFTGVLVWR